MGELEKVKIKRAALTKMIASAEEFLREKGLTALDGSGNTQVEWLLSIVRLFARDKIEIEIEDERSEK